jgi:hypothetical protein
VPPPFERSVFINCPFDSDFEPLLQAIAFCVTYMGYHPRIAPENSNNAAPRLARIVELVQTSKYGIHDLSRCKSQALGEFSRMNMPFELGIDHGAALFGPAPLSDKSILILEQTKYDFLKSLSDISGWDIESHNGDYISAVRHVCNWLKRHAGADAVGPARIMSNYAAFQEWYYERELAIGASEDEAMREWVDLGAPV